MFRFLSLPIHPSTAVKSLRRGFWVVVALLTMSSGIAVAQDTFSLSGTVWSDAAGTGDPAEEHTPVAGVIIRLHTDPDGDGDPSNGTVIQTTATDGDGYYVLVDLEPGYYVVEQVDPVGASSTYDTVGDLTDSLAAVELVDSDLEGIDFLDTGVVLLGISGQVWLDGPNQDQVFGADDLPMAGITVEVFADIDQDGLVGSADVWLNAAITRRDGRYGFGGLVRGSYVVRQVDPAGAASVNDSAGAPDDSQVGVNLIAADVTTASFLDTGITLGTLRGQVRMDLDADGDPTDNDPPLAGVTLLLFSDPSGSGSPFDGDPIELTATTLNGEFAFPNLPPGHYVVLEFDPQGASSTFDVSGSLTDNIVAATVVDADVNGLNFLDSGALTGVASGITWVDGSNQDGLFTEDDQPATGISVALYADLDGDGVLSVGDVFMGFTGTVAGGGFAFPPIVYGPYIAIQQTPPGATVVNDTDGSPTDATIGFTQAGSFFQNLYFLNQDLTLASIAGQARNDTDGDGDPTDTDPPLPNVRVRLYTDPDGDGDAIDGALLGTRVTNGQGRYLFTGLAPGNYLVQAESVAGASATYDPVGALTDGRIAMTLTGVDAVDRDFLSTGAMLASLSGIVLHDGPANDGVFGPDDIPLLGVTMELYADVNQNQLVDIDDLLISSVLTDASGQYAFTDLPSGDYLILERDPPGATSLLDTQGNPIDNIIAVTLAGIDASDLNFLDSGVTFSSIIGRVLDDIDSNGVADAHDRPLPGVTVRLYVDRLSDGLLAADDPLITTAVSDATGTFTFPDLPGGSYVLQQIPAPSATPTGDSSGPNDNLIGIQLTFQDDTSAVFLNDFDPTGYFYDAITGEILSGGSLTVSGPGSVSLSQNGSTGQYVFTTDGTAGTYNLTIIPPPGFAPAPLRSAQPTPLVPAGQPAPVVIGAEENTAAPGFLLDATAAANPFYLTFTLAPGDPLILNNNLPFVRVSAPTFLYWHQATPNAGGSPTSDLDGDLTPDLLEYAFGTDPASGLHVDQRYGVSYNAGSDSFDAFYTISEQGLNDLIFTVQVLSSLTDSPAGWSTTTRIPSSVSNGDGTRTLRFTDLENDPAIGGEPLGFVRIQVGLDPDLNGTPETVLTTPVIGFQRRTLPTSIVTWGASFVPAPLLQAQVDAVLGATLQLSNSLNQQTLQQVLTGASGYYLEVLTGDDAGHRIEIDSAASSGSSLALLPSSPHSTLTSLPAALESAHIAIHPFSTLASAFPPAHYTATNNPATADRVMTFPTSSQTFISHWLYASPAGPIWVQQGDADLIDRSSTRIDPQEGIFVHRRSTPLPTHLTGFVRAHPFAFRFAQKQNLIANPWPLPSSPILRSMVSANGFISSNNPAQADQISRWIGDLTPGTNLFEAYFYVRFGTAEYWVRQGDASLTDASNLLLFQPGTANFIRSIDGMPAFIAPVPWVP
jgi:large repetitive protein